MKSCVPAYLKALSKVRRTAGNEVEVRTCPLTLRAGAELVFWLENAARAEPAQASPNDKATAASNRIRKHFFIVLLTFGCRSRVASGLRFGKRLCCRQLSLGINRSRIQSSDSRRNK